MTLSPTELKTLAVESVAGQAMYAAASLLKAQLARRPYSRATALMRAWRASDHHFVRHAALSFLEQSLHREGRLTALVDNPLLRDFVRSAAAAAIRREFAPFDLHDKVRMRYPRPGEDPNRQGDLIILKRPIDATGEKGVILIKYSEAVERFVALFQAERLVNRYMLVIEPSWWGYQDASFFMLAASNADVVVQAPAQADFRFLVEHGFGLEPIRIGAGDWVDGRFFSPALQPRLYDVVMVSSWSPFKRHYDLFAALETIRREYGRKLRTALVGYPRGWTAVDIGRAVRNHGLSDQCDIFDSVPPAQVADIVSRSRLYVLLSRREGANKAMYEAMFCDTAVVAPAEHRGINHDHLNSETGIAFKRGALVQALLSGLARWSTFHPRAWAVRHTGFENATRKLNDALSSIGRRRGDMWKVDIVAKRNQPNLRYANDSDAPQFDGCYVELSDYLRASADD